ncbi:hypothetical protein SAMN06295885_2147 [Rathayibacter oskolensis]|uniref:Uncharacterized protein n=1 Tax=Rathayibacter oskolensis TaxID=1891671 RepID=A0A1X7NXF1_9MICO|nr:hypothetical protein [Rathayibacter oskolensis]SMH43085.1 hypothetical protein SAMN06295885_2147 [Rathayibacter oskolensis]
MTPAVPDALVPPALRLIRANRTFVTADGARGVPLTLHEAAGRVHVLPLLPTRGGLAAQRAAVAALRPHNEG